LADAIPRARSTFYRTLSTGDIDVLVLERIAEILDVPVRYLDPASSLPEALEHQARMVEMRKANPGLALLSQLPPLLREERVPRTGTGVVNYAQWRDQMTRSADVNERTVAAKWPTAAKIFEREFELEALKSGADDFDLAYVRQVLFSPESYVMYHGGREREMTDDELLIEMRGLAEGLRVWLAERKKRRTKA
jgi:hypothetical protein